MPAAAVAYPSVAAAAECVHDGEEFCASSLRGDVRRRGREATTDGIPRCWHRGQRRSAAAFSALLH